MTTTERGSFGSKLGIILATAGSAVGLGNVWRFPYMTGQNGGAAFILIYILFVILLGIPCMVAEFVVGRHGQTNAPRAYARFIGHRSWGWLGVMGVVTSLIILGFYSVIAGWCMQYLYASAVGELAGDATYVKDYFTEFSSSLWRPILWGLAFVVATHLVITRGVSKGIERASKVLMPLLLILLLIIVVAACMLPGAMSGVEFLLKPDFSKLSTHVFLDALGQAFFSLSLGMACLCTYASYFKKDTDLLRAASQIALLDLLVAILAGLMIFPAAFSVGVNPDSGPSLIFITLPNVFNQAFVHTPVVGYVVSLMFYALLALAALTSTISMFEISTAFFHEEMHIRRRTASALVTVIVSVFCVCSSLSMGTCPWLRVGSMNLLNFLDFLTGQFLMPFASFLTCICVGWVARKQLVRDQYSNFGLLRSRTFTAWYFIVRFVCPVCVTLIFFHQFGMI